MVLAQLMNNSEQTKKLFEVYAPKYKETPGGYTRVVRLGQRLGDGAEMAIIEFV
jgi:large subunit ribosomal protein L17